MASSRSFRFLLKPTVRQKASLERLLTLQCELYNAALEERKGVWLWERRSLSYFAQSKTLTGLRDVRPEVFECGVAVCRGTLKRLDRAFRAFYRRSKNGEAPGFPRFRSVHRFDSVQWEDTQGWRLNEQAGRIYLQGVGQVRIRLHRTVKGTPKALTVRREGRRWWLTLRCVDVADEILAPTGRAIGVDLGIVTLIATSDGDIVVNPRFHARSKERLASATRELASKQPGSIRHRRAVERFKRVHRDVRNQRADLAHQLSRRLVNRYDLIVTEELRSSKMVRRSKPPSCDDRGISISGSKGKRGLNRSIHDAGWAQLTSMIAYKAASAGRCHLVVDPSYTSQRCAECGHVAKGNRISQADFVCRACGHIANADVNAARNVLRAGMARRASARAG